MTIEYMGTHETQVFISYSHRDGRELARAMKDAIANHDSGLLFSWVDDELRRGENFDAVIKAAIDECDFAVCIITPAFNTSEYIQNSELPYLMEKSRSNSRPMVVLPVVAGGELLGDLAALHAGDQSNSPTFSIATASGDARPYREIANEIHDMAVALGRGGSRKALTKPQKKTRIREFVKKCGSWSSEEAHYQHFWEGLMKVIGFDQPSMLQFQKRVRPVGSKSDKKIDCFVPGVFIGESKSATESNLDAAEEQALGYARLVDYADLPQALICSDYRSIRVCSLAPGQGGTIDITGTVEFDVTVEELLENIHIIESLFESETSTRDLIDIRQQQKAGSKHVGHILNFTNVLMEEQVEEETAFDLTMRILFLLVADDLGILNANPSDRTPGRFARYVNGFDGGEDASIKLTSLFAELNDPGEHARRHGFPYVNGGLFAKSMSLPVLTHTGLDALRALANTNWAELDPFLFGSLYQVAHSREYRATHGQHFTSDTNIRKILDPLILDELRADLQAARGDRRKLVKLQERLAAIRFFDPAAGCGNFLLIAFMDMKALERDVIRALKDTGLVSEQTMTGDGSDQHHLTFTTTSADGKKGARVTVPLVQMSHYAGIEIGDTAAALARTVLVLAGVQAQDALNEVSDLTRRPLPLSEETNAPVTKANALTFDWASVWPGYTGGFTKDVFIIGNPPFGGAKERKRKGQDGDHNATWTDEVVKRDGTVTRKPIKGAGMLDFVTCWFLQAARHMSGTGARAAFVATNSITQGEQPYVLWTRLGELGMGIDFGYRSFPWHNGAGEQAAVHCVILGFSGTHPARKALWGDDGQRREVSRINAYVMDAAEVLLPSRTTPLQPDTQPMVYGSKPTDSGLLSNISPDEAARIRREDPVAAKYLRRLAGAEEVINGQERWCLWLVDATREDMRSSSELSRRIAGVKAMREASSDAQTRKDAAKPHLFQMNRQPSSAYLAVPSVSSEARRYVPMAVCDSDMIASNLGFCIADATPYTFGILQSSVFNTWTDTVTGRLESRLRISNTITYNNFPFPTLTDTQRETISAAAQAVIAARDDCAPDTLAQMYKTGDEYLYRELYDAHAALDAAVLAAYDLPPNATSEMIMAELFHRYQLLTGETATTKAA